MGITVNNIASSTPREELFPFDAYITRYTLYDDMSRGINFLVHRKSTEIKLLTESAQGFKMVNNLFIGECVVSSTCQCTHSKTDICEI